MGASPMPLFVTAPRSAFLDMASHTLTSRLSVPCSAAQQAGFTQVIVALRSRRGKAGKQSRCFHVRHRHAAKFAECGAGAQIGLFLPRGQFAQLPKRDLMQPMELCVRFLGMKSLFLRQRRWASGKRWLPVEQFLTGSVQANHVVPSGHDQDAIDCGVVAAAELDRVGVAVLNGPLMAHYWERTDCFGGTPKPRPKRRGAGRMGIAGSAKSVT
jgi:hypothetical protein